MKRKIINILRLIWKITFLENILVKITIDKPFGSIASKLPPNHYQYKKGTMRKACRHGINYKLDISDIVDWYIYFGFKESSRQSLYDLMKPYQTIIDVGANVGDVTLHAAKAVGNKGFVHSFEPDPINFKRLENNFKNIQLNQVGLGEAEGVCIIAYVESGNQGMNRIINDSKINNYRTQKISITSIDSYIYKNNLKNIDLIKIDVEGFELKVLKGAKKAIETFKPTLFIELDDSNLIEQGNSAKELIQLLEKENYRIIHSETKNEIKSDINFGNCHYDIIALSKDT